jgi:hypothetical protein
MFSFLPARVTRRFQYNLARIKREVEKARGTYVPVIDEGAMAGGMSFCFCRGHVQV